ncbi:TPA: asparagine synthase (glutamine-hydrolyzing) [Vibrio cholerae]|nr:asparagine synthase (glutamine-hydrolyzing) [Vibrio cholerae]EKF9280318.1 asparagine synthase (glutamine-hydrolyzing) [Vibrio cholerae]
MCGFIYAYDKKGDKDLTETMHQALYVMSDRGPDFQQFQSIGFSWFGHTRLSIIDTSEAANQPFSSSCGRYKLVFNGEIYNFRKVKSILNDKFNIQWQTDHSDTEVLLNSLIYLGVEKTLSVCEGMFAFVLHDKVNELITVARDPFGEKPLYSYNGDDFLILASSIEAIKCFSVTLSDNNKAKIEFFKFGAVMAPNTIYNEIQKIPASTYFTKKLTVDEKPQYHEYWNIATLKEIDRPSLNNIKDTILGKLESDVGVAFYLSGGIDSSIIAKTLSELPYEFKSKIKAHSIGFNFEDGGEVFQAQETCKELDIEHRYQILDDRKIYDYLEKYLNKLSEPLADPTAIPGMAIAESSVKDNKVVITGEGADELFWGYPHWNKYFKIESICQYVPSFFFPIGRSIAKLKLKPNSHFFEIIDRKEDKLPSFFSGCEIFTASEIDILLGMNAGDAKIHFHQLMSDKYADFNKLCLPETEWFTYIETKLRLPELILNRVDKVTMMYSQEARAPFLNRVLFSKSSNISFGEKFSNKINKPFLRKLVEGFLDSKILNRKKKGFSTPYQYVFEGEHASLYINRILDQSSYCGLNAEFIESLINDKAYYKLWAILIYISWKSNDQGNRMKVVDI